MLDRSIQPRAETTQSQAHDSTVAAYRFEAARQPQPPSWHYRSGRQQVRGEDSDDTPARCCNEAEAAARVGLAGAVAMDETGGFGRRSPAWKAGAQWTRERRKRGGRQPVRHGPD
jgi:hypothetical protein